ncbi:MAG: DUF502 domain-containing protein [Verrucomicrobia bacterium]|nr:DUF502 domain-containing protein [Verrucomicrobiota bacterium]
MKKYFFTGFITLLPLALTFIIVNWLFNLFAAPLAGITEAIILSYEKNLGLSLEHHDTLVLFVSRVIALILLFFLILFLGFCGQKFLINVFMKIPERLFSHIPIVGTVFRLSKDITKAVFSDNKKTFKETVLLPFPHDEALTIGFVTGDTPPSLKDGGKPFTDLVIFVPTAPHPMSGYVLLAPKKIVKPVDVSVEDAFKFLISCGVIHPGEAPPGEEIKK